MTTAAPSAPAATSVAPSRTIWFDGRLYGPEETPTVPVTELGVTVIEPGTGPAAVEGDSVVVDYQGVRSADGTEFDKSSSPIEFPLDRVISGWTEGVQLMKEGAKYEFYIPSMLAYGKRGAGSDIGPDETLIFQVELLAVR